MPKRSHGYQSGCRKTLTRTPRNKGKVSVVKQLKSYEIGDNVLVKLEPMIKKNLIHKRFLNKTGVIIEKRGNAYRVRVKDLNKEKDVLVLPVHLMKCAKR
jgi:large subunit ribosomal protein L21e